MEITWYGHSCFRLSERGLATTIIDPYDGQAFGDSPLRLKGDIVTVSHDRPGHNHIPVVLGSPYIVNGPGEYEVGGVFITGIQTTENREHAELANVLYVYDYHDLNVAHLGALNRVPSQAEVEDLGPVHILLILSMRLAPPRWSAFLTPILSFPCIMSALTRWPRRIY